jgi:hypothetical protein
MKMFYALLQFLHEDRRTEINRGTKRHIFEAFFSEITQTVTGRMFIAAYRERG